MKLPPPFFHKKRKENYMATSPYTIGKEGVAFICQWEGFRAKAYWDANGRVWTCGYGHTAGVTKSTVCDEAAAKRWVMADCAPTEKLLRSSGVALTQQQGDALVSFAYNVGLGNLKRSTLWKLVKAGAAKDKVMQQFYRWNRSGGKVLEGLAIRREGEAMLYATGKYPTYAEAKAHYKGRAAR